MSIHTAPSPIETEALQHVPLPELELPQAALDPSSRWRHAGLKAAKILVAATFPFAVSATAVQFGPPEHIEIAGQDVAIKPVIGKNTSDLDGVVVRPDHKTLLGKDIGLSIHTNINNFLPQNKQERAYLTQLWQDPKPEIERIKDAANDYMLLRGGGGLVAGMLLEAGVLITIGHQRRKAGALTEVNRELIHTHNSGRNKAEAVVAGAVLLGVYAVSLQTLGHQDHYDVHPHPQLNGTALAGTEINGLAGSVIPVAVALLSPEQANFYENATANLEAAIANTPSLQERSDDEVVYVTADDFEGVSGMAKLFGAAAKAINADGQIYSGDWTFGGSSMESYILDYPTYYSGHLPLRTAAGLHDTDTILQAEASRDDITVADNKTHNYDGLEQLILNDPRISTIGRFGTADIQRDPESTVDDFITNAVKEVCETRPDLMVLHDYKLADRIINQTQLQNCPLPLVIDGRSYNMLGQRTHTVANGNTTIEFTNGSAGGHTNTNPNLGIIQNPATITVVKINKTLGTVTFVPITIRPDGTNLIDESLTVGLQMAGAAKDPIQHNQITARSDSKSPRAASR